jgi:hypothetical protein
MTDQDISTSPSEESWSSEEETMNITEILMVDRPPETSTAPQESQEPHVTEAESETNQAREPEERSTAPNPNPGPLQSADDFVKSSSANGPHFNFDHLSYQKRLAQMDELKAWVNILLAKGVPLKQALTKLCSRFTGFLHNWYLSLGAYQQLQLLNLSYFNFFGHLYREFVGDLDIIGNNAKSEFFKMKCCSLLPRDIDRHIKSISERF